MFVVDLKTSETSFFKNKFDWRKITNQNDKEKENVERMKCF